MWVFRRAVVLCSMVAGLAAPAGAGGLYQDENELRLVQSVYVVVEGRVEDGCSTQPYVLRTEAALVLRRSRIRVLETSIQADHILSLYLSGFEHSQAVCVVHLRVALSRWEQMAQGHVASVRVYDESYMAAGAKNTIQSLLRENVSAIITDLAYEILKVRVQ